MLHPLQVLVNSIGGDRVQKLGHKIRGRELQKLYFLPYQILMILTVIRARKEFITRQRKITAIRPLGPTC